MEGNGGGETRNVDFDTLLSMAQKGDSEAFAAIWRAFHPPLNRYLRVVARPICDDACAETWYQVIKHLRTFRGNKDAFQGWLYTIARNRVIDWKRRLARHPETLMGLIVDEAIGVSQDPAEIFDEKVSTEAALARVAALPPDQAEAVMLRAVSGLSVALVAKIMDRSPGSVRVLCHRGLRQLALNGQEQQASTKRDLVV